MSEPRHTNRLADETSPYLLQHAHNPVDWHPWDAVALELSRREDRPILLSIGYAACHWCHVMERESFENDEIAALMNENFVCVKVDREERPDLDDIYMTAVQMISGHGGWPLTVFLTPDLKPFFGGTYFPPEDRPGMPGFRRVLHAVRRSFDEERGAVEDASQEVVGHIGAATQHGDATTPPKLLDGEMIEAAVRDYRRRFEPVFGGFSHAPKFPHPTAVSLLLRSVQRSGDADVLHMATLSLDRMAYGGLYDHLAGGFHRYATDDRWLVPHFEKMLYDNALLARAYLEAVQLTGHEEYERVARETLDWVLRDMQAEDGGYYSTLDADSEGVEGKFYVWDRAEVDAVLGDDAATFCAVYDVTERGNWEGSNILNLAKPAAAFHEELGVEPAALEALLARSRDKLLAVREQRVRPGLDDKILTDWNGLMIAAMATGYRVLGDERFLDSARRAARFLLDNMIVDDRLLHSHRAGRSRLLAYSDDHANLAWALIELFEATGELDWLERARWLTDRLIELFWDNDGGGLFFTGNDHEQLVARMKPGHDSATPSGNAVATHVLLRLETISGEEAYGRRARDLLGAFQQQMKRNPTAYPHMLAAADYELRPAREIALIGSLEDEGLQDLLGALRRQFRPRDLIVAADPSTPEFDRAQREVPLLAGKEAVDDKPTYYLCESYACRRPTHEADEVLRQKPAV